jgi:hypothetical protein
VRYSSSAVRLTRSSPDDTLRTDTLKTAGAYHLRIKPHPPKPQNPKGKKGKREYLNDSSTLSYAKQLNDYSQKEVIVPRVRIDENQEIETLINEEALLFAQYLRNEKQTRTPRIASLDES